jgi:hypothetical protein
VKPLRGLEDIARAVGVGHVDTLTLLIRRTLDPLPVRYGVGRRAWIWPARLDLWKRRERRDSTLPIAEGWKAIADAAGLSRSTAIRYASRAWHPLPVHGLGADRVWAHESALQDWIDAEDEPGWKQRFRAPAEAA